MDKQLRHQIKRDRFVEEVGHTVSYLSEHRDAVKKYGALALGVVIIAVGIYAYTSYQRRARQNAIRQAAIILDGVVGEQNPTGGPVFKTQADKDSAALKAFSEIAAKYAGSREGLLARFYTGNLLCDMSKIKECEAAFLEVSKGGDANIASLGKLSLATLYGAQNRSSEAEALLRELVNNPTPVVSKEQAQLVLARTIQKSKPQEARMLLESLQALDRPAITRAAVGILGEMLNQQPAR